MMYLWGCVGRAGKVVRTKEVVVSVFWAVLREVLLMFVEYC